MCSSRARRCISSFVFVEKRQNKGMRPLFLGAALVLLGCAHEEELRPAREPSTDATFSMAPPPATYATEAPQGRPRLSKTITLGEEDHSPSAPPPPAGGPGNGVNVTVNNNVNVTPPVVYGGYGYGGYSYGGSHVPAWRGSGWEGAQRTAAPGQTPAVGGNWSPPPSYGPRQMK